MIDTKLSELITQMSDEIIPSTLLNSPTLK